MISLNIICLSVFLLHHNFLYPVVIIHGVSLTTGPLARRNQAGGQVLSGTSIYKLYYRGADKSLARPTSRCILFDCENISFDVSLVIYIYIYIYK